MSRHPPGFATRCMACPMPRSKRRYRATSVHFSLEQGYLPGQAGSDIDLPTHEIRGPFVVFSTGESWASIANGYRQLAEVDVDPDKVKALVPRAEADRSKAIAQIVARLHKEVRIHGNRIRRSEPAAGARIRGSQAPLRRLQG